MSSRTPFLWLLPCLFLAVGSGCIYVQVEADDLWHELAEDDEAAGFQDLQAAVEGHLTDPASDLALVASPWHAKAEWNVRFAPGSDGAGAFHGAKEAVLRRMEREGATMTAQEDEGPHLWSCSFRIDGEPGEASVRLVEQAHEGEERPHELQVRWEQSD